MPKIKRWSGEQSPDIQRNQYQSLTQPHRRIDWHHTLVGYLIVFPTLALTILLTLAIQLIVPNFVTHNTVLMLTVCFIALFWGRGPTILMLILGIFLLDFFAVPPLRLSTLHRWPDIIQVIPYFLAGLLIAEITKQRQRHQQQLEHAINALREHALELEALNSSLQTMNQTKNQQLAMAAHELKTPLTALQLYSQWLQRQSTSSSSKSTNTERLANAYRKIEEQTQRLGTLIEELFDEQATLSPQKQDNSQHCDLAALCDRVVEHYRLTTSKPITLTLSSTSLRVPARSHHLEQVLNNLISNAIKYSPEDGRVEVALHQKNALAHLSVYNTGPGIASDQIPLLFIPHYRTPEAQASSVAGQGLGLAIVRILVEQYHGQVWCESKLGEGTTFIVELSLLLEG